MRSGSWSGLCRSGSTAPTRSPGASTPTSTSRSSCSGRSRSRMPGSAGRSGAFPSSCSRARACPIRRSSIASPGFRSCGPRISGASPGACSRSGSDDESRALAAGYASHLLADMIAHNYFVPEHERRWFNCPVVTHAASEWAMDAHVASRLLATPGDLLRRHRVRLARHAASYLRCTERAAAGALTWLDHGERFLRATGLPRTVGLTAGVCDASMRPASRPLRQRDGPLPGTDRSRDRGRVAGMEGGARASRAHGVRLRAPQRNASPARSVPARRHARLMRARPIGLRRRWSG